MKKYIRNVTASLDRSGFDVLDVDQSGKHLRLTVLNRETGKTGYVTASKTPKSSPSNYPLITRDARRATT